MRRGGYALFAFAVLSVIIAVACIGIAITGSADRRSGLLGYGILQFAFALVNAALGFVLLTRSRTA
jgi:hypothetical protein